MPRNKSENETLSPRGDRHSWLWTKFASARAIQALGDGERISITAGEMRILLAQERDRARRDVLSSF